MSLLKPGKWAFAFSRRGGDFDDFVDRYFCAGSRRTLIIFGAGFDPRAAEIPAALARCDPSMEAWLLREERPAPKAGNVQKADDATARLVRLFKKSRVIRFDVFESDGALAVPASVIAQAPMGELNEYDDIVLDVSALSLGVSFPLAKLLYEFAASSDKNLHLMVASASNVDKAIRASFDAVVQSPRGFYRPPVSDAAAAVMWVPQLQPGLFEVLERIGSDFEANDVCPIVPFPTLEVRQPEDLFVEYERLLNGAWRVDPRDVIYAAENDPLDIYRTLIRISRERREVFESIGPSEIVLTPMGSKVVALGALMAALEDSLSVRYIEARDYDESFFPGEQEYERMSIWLHGGPQWEAPGAP